jgi:hypothetical protein
LDWHVGSKNCFWIVRKRNTLPIRINFPFIMP